jgi:hypothetical protein
MAHRFSRDRPCESERSFRSHSPPREAPRAGGGSYQGSDAGASGSNTGGSGSRASRLVGGSGTTFVTSGSASGSVVSSGVAQSGTVVSSGSVASGAPTDAAAFCRVPAIDAGSLPFVVDTVYKPSGWIGDAPAYPVTPVNPPAGIPSTGIAPPAGSTARISLLPADYSSVGDACTPDGVGRSSANAKGACWKVTYVPFPSRSSQARRQA